VAMTPKAKSSKSVGDYIAAAPKDARKKLREMRSCIRKAAPGASESLKYGMPAFSYNRTLVIFGAFKHHIGFYPRTSTMKAFAKDLSRFVKAKGSVQFPLDEPLPLALIRKMTLYRVRESLEQDGK